MKRIILLILSTTLILGLFTACSSPKESILTNNEPISTIVKEQDIREVAYNQLTSKDKERVAGNWKDSKLSKITLKKGIGNITDNSYIGKEVYLIDFTTKELSLNNNIIVFLGMDNNKLIGYGYID